MHAVETSHMITSTLIEIHSVPIFILKLDYSIFMLVFLSSYHVNLSFPTGYLFLCCSDHLPRLANKIFICLNSALVLSKLV